jgi:hypothetical protein
MQFNFPIHDHHAWPESQALLLRDVRVAMSAQERRPTLTRIELGNMSMATAAPAPCADSFLESAMTQSARKFLLLGAISCAMAVTGCAKNTTQREVRADPAQVAAPAAPAAPAAAPVRRHSEVRIRRPNRSLLVPQSAPDCEFRRADLKTVDPDEWARLKLDYERQCYREAEQTVRNRLRMLQASSKCEIVR